GEAPAFFALLEGRFEVLKKYGSSVRQLAVREPGAYMGELPIVLGGPFIAGARALDPSRLLRLEARDFRRLLHLEPALREAILATVLSRVEGIEEESGTEEAPLVVVGGRFDAGCHDIREFLSRNRLPFEWFDPADGRTCESAGVVDASQMPLVILPDGTRHVRPSLIELARAVGLRTRPEHDRYDVVVIGGGPAGLAAAVYGASEGLRTLLLEQLATGGQAGTSSRIENYLGFPSGLSGDELGTRAQAQAERFGAELVVGRCAQRIDVGDGVHRVVFEEDGAGGEPGRATSIETHAVVLATGVDYRKLEVPGIDRFLGTSVFYGAARTEARGMRGLDIILVGGGNSAGQAAMFFSNYARSVTILVRGAGLQASMSQYLIDQLATKENVTVRARGEIVAVEGAERLEAVTIRDSRTRAETRETSDAIFVFIGADAITDWLPDAIVRDERGYVCTGRDVLDLATDDRPWPLERDPYLLETSVPGIFAAGDVRHGSIKRVAAGVGEGSMSIAFVHAYLAAELERAAVTS
ncbi:MAG: FAD-dependent oxidoreductase, partial [Candidatus Eremiobacteraeota bacterium]|nr:FAD-dependent oxidoreductase [Candidatus Eremiobacteraeota bacterium]